MRIRNSVKAVIIKDNKLLVTKLSDENGVYYLLPGGGQEAGEKLDETLIRECSEEAGFLIEVKRLIFLRECFLDKGLHRVEFMFKCEILNETKSAMWDKNQIGIEWIEIDNIQSEPLFPEELRKLINLFNKGIEHQTYLGEIK